MSSKSLNKVQLIGNVTRDPELRYTPQGNAVCTMGLATNRSWKTETGEIREEAEFHRLVAWNKLAELCSQLCSKGRKIYVEGRLQTRTFTGSDNAQHTITEIVIDDMLLLDSKIAGSANAFTPNASASQAAPVQDDSTAVEPVKEEVAEESAKPTKKKKAVKEEAVEEVAATAPTTPTTDVSIEDIPF